MNNKDMISKLSDDVKQKLAACKSPEGIRKILAEAGIEALDDRLLDAVAGGFIKDDDQKPCEFHDGPPVLCLTNFH